MQCTNCGEFIFSNEHYYRAGKNRTTFCSQKCVWEMYEELCTKDEIEKTIEHHRHLEQPLNSY